MLKDKLKELADLELKSQREAEKLLKGKKVKIIDKKYNGQIAGKSKPSLYGKIITIEWVHIDYGKVIIGCYKYLCGLNLKQVEILGEE